MIQNQPQGSSARGGQRLFGLRLVNLGLLAAGIVAVVIGYVLLDRGSTVAAPLLLTLGYAVLVPAGLLAGLGGSGAHEPAAGE